MQNLFWVYCLWSWSRLGATFFANVRFRRLEASSSAHENDKSYPKRPSTQLVCNLGPEYLCRQSFGPKYLWILSVRLEKLGIKQRLSELILCEASKLCHH